MGKNNGAIVWVFFNIHDCKRDTLDKTNPNKDLTQEDCWWKVGTGVVWLFTEREV